MLLRQGEGKHQRSTQGRGEAYHVACLLKSLATTGLYPKGQSSDSNIYRREFLFNTQAMIAKGEISRGSYDWPQNQGRTN